MRIVVWFARPPLETIGAVSDTAPETLSSVRA
jgi:hypothetical protein